MKPAVRSVYAILAGLLVGMAIIVSAELGGQKMLSPPDPTDAAVTETNEVADPAEVALERPTELPASAFVVVLVGWLAGSALGAFTTVKISDRNWRMHAAIVTALFLAAGIYNLATLPHPLWMWPSAVLAFAVGGHLGATMGARAKAVRG